MIKKFLLVLLFIITFSFGLVMGNKLKNESYIPISTNKITPVPTLTIKIDKGLTYANLELLLKEEQNNISYPRSLLFAFQIGNFHPDWECNSSGYSEHGFRIDCQQKACSISKSIQWPNKLNSEQRDICAKELATREYSQSLNNLSIKATEYEVETEIIDYSKIIDQNKFKKTNKGIFYEFNKTIITKYSNSYSAIFYSPFELTDNLSKMGGTFYGADWIYGRYTIEAEVTGDDIDENKVIKLYERVIDSIVFIQPNNNL